MSDKPHIQTHVPGKKEEDVQIEPLTDETLEDVSGGTLDPCPIASCSANVCSG